MSVLINGYIFELLNCYIVDRKNTARLKWTAVVVEIPSKVSRHGECAQQPGII